MIRLFETALMLLLVSSGLLADIRADEHPADRPRAEFDTLSVDDVFANWKQAVKEIERVDVEFMQYVYDLDFESVMTSEGRLACETGGRQYMSFRPSPGKTHVGRIKRSGGPFDVREGRSERWIMDTSQIMSIDDAKKEVLIFDLKNRQRDSTALVTGSLLEQILKRQGDSIIAGFTMIGQIGGLISYKSPIDLMNEPMHDRWQITITREDKQLVSFSLKPKHMLDAAAWSQIDVQLSRQTGLPDAMKITDPAGTRETVYVFRNPRINGCPETVQGLFDPDLTGYATLGNVGVR